MEILVDHLSTALHRLDDGHLDTHCVFVVVEVEDAVRVAFDKLEVWKLKSGVLDCLIRPHLIAVDDMIGPTNEPLLAILTPFDQCDPLDLGLADGSEGEALPLVIK